MLVLSHEANESPEVRREIDLAAYEKVRLLGIRVDDAWPTGGLAYQLSGLNWIDAQRSTPSETADTLAKAIRDQDSGITVPTRTDWRGHLASRLAVATITAIVIGFLLLTPNLGRPLLPANWCWLTLIGSCVGAVGVFFAVYFRQHGRARASLIPALLCALAMALPIAAGRGLYHAVIYTWNVSEDDVCTLGHASGAATVATDEMISRIDDIVHVRRTASGEQSNFLGLVFVPPPSWRSAQTSKFLEGLRKLHPLDDPITLALEEDASNLIEYKLALHDSGTRIVFALFYMLLHLLAVSLGTAGLGFLLAAIERRAKPPQGQVIPASRRRPASGTTEPTHKAVS